DDEKLFDLPPIPPWPSTPGDPQSIDRAGKLLAASEKPVLFVGSQLWWDDASEALRAFVNRLDVPTVMNGMDRGTLPSTNPRALNLARKPAFCGPDCSVVVGRPLDFRVGYGASINAAAKLIQIDRDPTKIGKNRPVDVALVGDA